MNNRTKRLYIVVPLLWVVVIAAAAWMAYARSPKGPGEAEEEEEKALAPGGVGRCVAAGTEMSAWEMSVPPARGAAEPPRQTESAGLVGRPLTARLEAARTTRGAVGDGREKRERPLHRPLSC